MPELAEFVRRGATRISPLILHRVYKVLPMLKIEFAQIEAPHYPHLEQPEMFARRVFAFIEGQAS